MLLNDKWCRECGGPCTRSEKYAPAQPENSPLCAPCWYNKANPKTPLLSTGDLDDLDDSKEEGAWGAHLVGRLVDWHSEIYPLVLCPDGGIRVEVHLTCRCGKVSDEVYYANSGLHHGAWCYISTENGKYLANLRDQEWRCDACEKPAILATVSL